MPKRSIQPIAAIRESLLLDDAFVRLIRNIKSIIRLVRLEDAGASCDFCLPEMSVLISEQNHQDAVEFSSPLG